MALTPQRLTQKARSINFVWRRKSLREELARIEGEINRRLQA